MLGHFKSTTPRSSKPAAYPDRSLHGGDCVMTKMESSSEATRFARALETGHGRALQETLRTCVLPDAEAMLDACVHNVAYDPQLEGSRACWLLEILDAAGATSRLSGQILTRASTTDDCWDLAQLCELALVFAKRGEPQARELLYEVLERRCDPTCPGPAYEPILKLDGEAGLLRIVEDRGRRIAANPEEAWLHEDVVWQANDVLGTERTQAVLQKAAASNALVVSFLDAMRVLNEEGTRRDAKRAAIRATLPEQFDAKGFLEQVAQPSPGEWPGWSRTWAVRAPNEELVTIAHALDGEDDPVRLGRLLQAFLRRTPENALPRLLSLLGHTDELVSQRALDALGKCRHPQVRALGLDRARAGVADWQTLGLFIHNYEPGDHAVLEKLVASFDHHDDAHWFFGALIDVLEANPAVEARGLMLLVYEQTPCSDCRHKSVALMKSLGVLPEEVREECRYDANLDVRALVVS